MGLPLSFWPLWINPKDVPMKMSPSPEFVKIILIAIEFHRLNLGFFQCPP